MRREKDGGEKEMTGKRLFISISCLVLLLGIPLFLAYISVEGIGKKDNIADRKENLGKQEDSNLFRVAGGFDNSIDDQYLPIILKNDGKDKTGVLKSYEEAWKEQVEGYLEDYRARCNDPEGRKMAEEYLSAVQRAVDAQKKLMDHMNVEEERQLWYSAQIYRCAFIKDIRGEVGHQKEDLMVIQVDMRETEGALQLNYEICGEFTNEIDQKYVTSMHDGCEAEVRSRQQAFDLDWCNQLGELTMEFYEGLDEEGKQLAGIWQKSREDWKAASNSRFWFQPEELNFEDQDVTFWENGAGASLMEKDGWINRLYYLQLQSMMENKAKLPSAFGYVLESQKEQKLA